MLETSGLNLPILRSGANGLPEALVQTRANKPAPILSFNFTTTAQRDVYLKVKAACDCPDWVITSLRRVNQTAIQSARFNDTSISGAIRSSLCHA
jgi:hypothetical protein